MQERKGNKQISLSRVAQWLQHHGPRFNLDYGLLSVKILYILSMTVCVFSRCLPYSKDVQVCRLTSFWKLSLVCRVIVGRRRLDGLKGLTQRCISKV